jgi:hypothetical protein
MLLVEPDIRTRVDELARANGTTHSIEGARYLRLGLEYEARRGGPRTMHLLQACAEIALGMYAHEDEWIDDPAKFPEVIGTWYQVLIEHAPLTWKATPEAMAALGHDLFAELLVTRDSRRADRLRYYLRALSKARDLSPETRQQFALAADHDAFLLPPQSEQPLPLSAPPADWTATSATHLISAMRTANVMLGRPSAGEPDDDAIALVLTDANLRRQGGVPESVRTREQFRQWQTQLRPEEPDKAVETVPPPAPAEPEALPDHVRDRIARGRQLIAAVRGLLEMLSRDPEIPRAIRNEFSAAATHEIGSGETKTDKIPSEDQ